MNEYYKQEFSKYYENWVQKKLNSEKSASIKGASNSSKTLMTINK